MMRSITLLASTLLFASACTISFDDDGHGDPIAPDAMHPGDVPDGGGDGDAYPPPDAAWTGTPDAGWGGWPDAGKIPPDAGWPGDPDGGWWISDASVPPDAYSPDATAYPDAGCWDDPWCVPTDDAGYPPIGDAGFPHPGDAGCDP